MGDLPAIVEKSAGYIQDTLAPLAREIAVNHLPLKTILEHYQITPERWVEIQRDERFKQILISEIQAWSSALNTEQRTKLKAAAIVEEFLPEANKRLHDGAQALPAKVELAKLIARIAGVGVTGAGVEGATEKFSVTINLGASAQVKIEGQSPSKMIEATTVEA